MLLIQVVVVNYINSEEVWLTLHGTKAVVILFSLLLYCCVAKRYRHWLRDEVVNERYLVEEIYDRELRLAEAYGRERTEEMILLYARNLF